MNAYLYITAIEEYHKQIWRLALLTARHEEQNSNTLILS